MRLERWAFIIVGVVACGRATPNEPKTTTTDARGARSYQPATSGPAPTVPPSVRHADLGCQIDLQNPPPHGDLTTELSFGPGEAVFATLRGYTAIVPRSVSFPVSAQRSAALVTVRDYSSTVWGWSEANDVQLFANRPALIGETFAPNTEVPLQWTGKAGASSVEVKVDLDDLGVSVTGELPCDAAALMPGVPFDPKAAITAFQPGGLRGVLQTDRIAASFASAAGIPLPTALQQLTSSVVVAQQGDQLRVAFPLAQGLLVGWVTRDKFEPLASQPTSDEATTEKRRCGRGIVARVDGLVRCGEPVAIVAELEGQRRVVGQSVDVHLLAEGPHWTEVRVAPLAPVAGVRILARTEDLAGCHWVGAERNVPFANEKLDDGEGERSCF